MTSPYSLSYYLSIFTIVTCFVLKVPQIINVYEKKSAVGINISAVLMEIGSYTITALYNFTNGYSLITYLEYPIILVQQMILIFLILKYKNEHTSAEFRYAVIIYVCIVLGFMGRVIPSFLLNFLVPLCTPVSSMSKCVYIYGMIAAESAESVSLLTWKISITTNLFRIYTVLVDSGDRNLLFNFVVSTLLSCAVLATALHYQEKARTIREQTDRHNE